MATHSADVDRLLGPDPEIERLLGPAGPSALPEAFAPPSGVSGGDNAMVGGAYEGASRFDRDVALWNPPIRSADLDLIPYKPVIDGRTRDTLRNDAYVMGGANIHRDNIVGSIFLLNAKPEYKVLGLDEKWAEEFQEEAESKFTLWAESPNNWPDAARINTLTAMVRLAVGIYVASGEVLGSVEWLRDGGDFRPYNTAIQMIDLDRLSTPPDYVADPNVRGGVRRNRYGAPQGYYVQQAHPADWLTFGDVYSWKYVPVRKPWGRLQMIHIFEQTRPDQTRGVADMVSALKELRITKRFRDIVLQNAVVNATYAASIESELPDEAVFAQLGGGNMDKIGPAISQYAEGYLSSIAQYVGTKGMRLDGVKIPHLFPGTKLQLRNAGTPGGVGTEFEQSLLRYIAATLGVSYEQLSRDYSKSNYSSIRASMTETWKFMQSRKRMVADRFASMGYTLWLEEAINNKRIDSLTRQMKGDSSWYYEGLNSEALSSCEWVGASRGQIDELKETQAAVLRLKYHLSTYEDEMARLGKDWRKSFAQSEREKKMMVERGIEVVDAGKDNMMNAATGSPREKQAKDQKDDGSGANADA